MGYRNDNFDGVRPDGKATSATKIRTPSKLFVATILNTVYSTLYGCIEPKFEEYEGPLSASLYYCLLLF